MAKKTEQMMEDPVQEPEATKPRLVQIVPSVPAKKVSFDVWASRRGIKDHHKRGMRAHLKNPEMPRTLESWDLAFQNY